MYYYPTYYSSKTGRAQSSKFCCSLEQVQDALLQMDLLMNEKDYEIEFISALERKYTRPDGSYTTVTFYKR